MSTQNEILLLVCAALALAVVKLLTRSGLLPEDPEGQESRSRSGTRSPESGERVPSQSAGPEEKRAPSQSESAP